MIRRNLLAIVLLIHAAGFADQTAVRADFQDKPLVHQRLRTGDPIIVGSGVPGSQGGGPLTDVGSPVLVDPITDIDRVSGGGPIIVGSGAGLAEYYTILIASRLEQILSDTRDSDTLQLNRADQETLSMLIEKVQHGITLLFDNEIEGHFQWSEEGSTLVVSSDKISNPNSVYRIESITDTVDFWLLALAESIEASVTVSLRQAVLLSLLFEERDFK